MTAPDRPGVGTDRLSVLTTVTDGIQIVAPAGEDDHQTGPALRDALKPRSPQLHIVIDMHDVTFMDSSGVNILLVAHHELHDADGWLRLAALNDPAQRIVQIVGLDTLIPCHPTLTNALHT